MYRICGNVNSVKKLRNAFTANSATADVDSAEVHDLASLLKLYFRELHTPLIPNAMFEKLMAAMAAKEFEGLHKYVLHLLKQLPAANWATLELMLNHLVRVLDKCETNKMTSANIATCFGPTLMRPVSAEVGGQFAFEQSNATISILKYVLELWAEQKKAGSVRKNSSIQRPNLGRGAKSPLRSLFNKYDEAGSGELDAKALEGLVKEMLAEDDPAVAATLEELRSNSTTIGYERFAELAAAIQQSEASWWEENFHDRSGHARGDHSHAKPFFDKYDTEQTGSISADDMRQICYDMGDFLTDAAFAKACEELKSEANGGKIAYEPFRAWWGRFHTALDTMPASEWSILSQAIYLFQAQDPQRKGTLGGRAFDGLHSDLLEQGMQLPGGKWSSS